jgi:hypothetical protein
VREFALVAQAVIKDRRRSRYLVLVDMSHVLERRFNIHHIGVQLERDSRSTREHF